jgi:hypothetical protein
MKKLFFGALLLIASAFDPVHASNFTQMTANCAVNSSGVQCFSQSQDGSIQAYQVLQANRVTSLTRACAVVDRGIRCWQDSIPFNLDTSVPTLAESGVITVARESGHTCFIDDFMSLTPPSAAANQGKSVELTQSQPNRTGRVLLTASSGLPVVVRSNTPTVCSAANLSVVMLSVGACDLSVEQQGNVEYKPTSTTIYFNVLPSCFLVQYNDCDSDNDGIPDSVEFRMGTDVAIKDNDIFADTQLGRTLFVAQMYRDALGRPYDGPGLMFWQTQLAQGGDPLAQRVSVAKSFVFSQEFESKRGALLRFYLVGTQAPPFDSSAEVPAGFTYWLDRLNRDASLFLVASAFAELLAAKNDTEFVQYLFQTALGRSGSVDDVRKYVAEIPARTRAGVFLEIVDSDAARAYLAPEVNVTACYLSYLQRAPDFGDRATPGRFSTRFGLGYWANEVRAGRGVDGLVQAFLQSTEVRKRFLP